MFSAKDLSTFLSSEVSRDDEKVDAKELEKAKFNPRLGTCFHIYLHYMYYFRRLCKHSDQSKKVTRYFPGKAPAWVATETPVGVMSSAVHPEASSSSGVNNSASDNRLMRLASTAAANSIGFVEEGKPRRRRVYEAEVIDDKEEIEISTTVHVRRNRTYEAEIIREKPITEEERRIVSKETNSDDEVAKRRARTLIHRSDALSDVTKQPPIITTEVSVAFIRRDLLSSKKEFNIEEEGSSEFETGSEEEDEVIKPMFIPKHKRDTLKNQATIELEEELKLQERCLKNDMRQEQTRQMVAESMKRNDERNNLDSTDVDSDAGIPDNLDDVDDEVEFDNWKLREMKRLARDAEERELIELERSYIEKRRQMTDEERLEDDRRMGKFDNKEVDKSKYKFLQKYYHKGAFYVDEKSLKGKDDVRVRDYSAPTLADKGVNREALPKMMQVKNFGKRGRTKYTHLVDQDTTFVDRSFAPRIGTLPSTEGGDVNPYTGGAGSVYSRPLGAHEEREDRWLVRHDLHSIRPKEEVRRAFEQKRVANQSLDTAGRLHKKFKR